MTTTVAGTHKPEIARGKSGLEVDIRVIMLSSKMMQMGGIRVWMVLVPREETKNMGGLTWKHPDFLWQTESMEKVHPFQVDSRLLSISTKIKMPSLH